MSNDRLRVALARAGLEPDELASEIEVDAKTVQRWLSGRTPYSRHRSRVAHALGATELELWPEAAVSDPGADHRREILGAFPRASDPRAPAWLDLLKRAAEQIDLLDYTLLELLQTPGTTDLLAAKAAEGCPVRILIAAEDSDPVSQAEWELNPDSEMGRGVDHPDRPLTELRDNIARARHQLHTRLSDRPGVELREFDAQRFNTILRFDDQMLVTLHLWGTRNQDAPLLHLRKDGEGGLFDQFCGHYETIWELGEPLEARAADQAPEPEEDEYEYLPENLRPLSLEDYERESAELREAYENELAETRREFEEAQDELEQRRGYGRQSERRGEDDLAD